MPLKLVVLVAHPVETHGESCTCSVLLAVVHNELELVSYLEEDPERPLREVNFLAEQSVFPMFGGCKVAEDFDLFRYCNVKLKFNEVYSLVSHASSYDWLHEFLDFYNIADH